MDTSKYKQGKENKLNSYPLDITVFICLNC